MFITSAIIATTLVSTDIRIEQVLPENTIAVLSVSDVSEFVSHLENLGVCDAVCEAYQSVKGGEGETCQLTQLCTQLDANLGADEKIIIPNGHAGMGIYPVVDFEVGSVGLGAMMLLHVGDSNVGDVMFKTLDAQGSDLEIEFETVSISGREVLRLQNDFGPIAAQMPVPIDFSSMLQLYLAYTDGYIIMGTEPDGIAALFAAIDGDAPEDSLETNDDYVELMDRCGTDGDIQGVVLLTNLADTFAQMDTSGMGLMFLPMLKSVIGDIDGIAQSIALSPTKDTIMSGTYALVMGDGRNGLMSLLGSNSHMVEIPAFVGEDTISYSQSHINYDQIAPLVKEITAANPMLSMQMNPQMMEQLQMSIEMFTSTLGTQTHVTSTGSLPYSAESYGHLMAIECVKEEQLSNVLGMMLPSMGATPSDFLGNQIFTMDLGSSMMMPIPMNLSFSIAVGGGYAFLGNSNAVENALRSIANPKESKSDHGANAASTLIGNSDVSGWGYGDPLKSLKIQLQMSKEASDEMFAQMAEFDPEMAEEMLADVAHADSIQDAIVKCMSLFLGPMSWNMTTDETGITSEIIMVKPTE